MYSTLFIFLMIYAKSNAMVQLQDFFPYGPSNGDTSMYDVNTTNLDDGSSPSITLSHAFQFFGHSHNSLWVNINGGVSFNSPISQYTPDCNPLSTSSSMISPFWADVDLRARRGFIYFRQTTDAIVLNKALTDVKTAFPSIENLTALQWAYVATWLNVSFYDDTKCLSTHNKSNTFQLALVTDGVYSFAIFMYNQIQWTTGTASGAPNCSGLGGTPARAGFDNGEGQMYIIDGSCNQTILNLASKSAGSNTLGKYVFQVNKAKIIASGSSTLQVITNPVTLPVVNTTTQPPPLSTTESLEEQLFKLHFQRLKDHFNELKKRLMEDCMKIVDRPALEKECFLDLEKLANLEHELSKTTKMDELTKVESEVDNLEIAIKQIEKDIEYLFLI